MRDANRFERKRSGFVRFARRNRQKTYGAPGNLMLFDPLTNELQRVRWSPDRQVGTESREQIRHAADMVFMPVRQDQPANPRRIQQQVIEARVIDVDAEIGRRKRDAAIDEQHVVALLESHAVHPDFAQSAERDDAKRRGVCCGIGRQRNAPDTIEDQRWKCWSSGERV